MAGVNRGKLTERLAGYSSRTQKIFWDYLAWLNAKDLTDSSIRNYQGTPVQILESTNKDFDQLTAPVLKEFLRGKGKPHNINKQEQYIKLFLQYLNETGVNQIDPNCLAGERYSRKVAKEQAKEATPLTLKQVVEIRRKVRNNPRLLVSFELAYKYEMTLDEFEVFSIEKYDFSNQLITLPNRKIYVNDIIHSTLCEKKSIFNRSRTRNTYQEHFEKIGELIEVDLTWSDLVATRAKYFFCCGLCQRLFEPIPSNLALVQFDGIGDGDTIYLVCNECAQGGVLNG